jgi:BASS family bile acid:Na+ symporter
MGPLLGSPDHIPDPFRSTSGSAMAVLIAITMFAIGWMLPHDEVRQVFDRWPTVLGGTTIQYAAMPLLAYAAARLLNLQGDYFVGAVVVGCVPGAMASNVLTLNARGNTSYSVSLTTTATLLSPLVVPVVLALALAASQTVEIPFWRTSRMLLLTVVGPVIGGYLLHRRFPRWESQARQIGSAVANLAILWIIAAVVGRNREAFTQVQHALFVALLLVNLGGYSVGYAGGWLLGLPGGMRRALTLEIGMQNAGLGATLATQLFPDRSAIAIAPAMYTFGCMLTGTLLARVWATVSQRQENPLSSP